MSSAVVEPKVIKGNGDAITLSAFVDGLPPRTIRSSDMCSVTAKEAFGQLGGVVPKFEERPRGDEAGNEKLAARLQKALDVIKETPSAVVYAMGVSTGHSFVVVTASDLQLYLIHSNSDMGGCRAFLPQFEVIDADKLSKLDSSDGVKGHVSAFTGVVTQMCVVLVHIPGITVAPGSYSLHADGYVLV